MAINLKLEKFGAQFSAFVDFAKENAANGDTLACIGGDGLLDPAGKPRKIVAKTDDDRIKRFRENLFFGRTADQAKLNDAVRDLFRETILKVCGAKSFEELPPAVRDVMKEDDYEANGGHPLSARRILAVTGAIRAIADKAVSVEGEGQAADTFRGVVDAKLASFRGTGSEKAVALKDEANRIAKNRFNLFFASDMKALQSGVESQFEKDHDRIVVDPKFMVGGETLTFDRHTSLGEKRDIIAKFLRQDKNAKFSDLGGAERNKAYAMMSIIAQRFGICMLDGATKCLSAGPTSEAPIKFGQTNRKASDSPVTFSFGGDGSLRIHYVSAYDEPQLTLDGEHFSKVFAEFDPGSSVTITADVEIGAEEFEKVANSDYTQFDESAPDAVMKRQLDEDEAGAAKLGPFRFGEGVKVNVSCTAVLNGGQLMVDQTF